MKKRAICLLSLVPCRSEPNDRSEMVSQLLFGDLVEIKAQKDSWSKILIIDDNYQAWVDSKQLHPLESKEFEKLLKARVCFLEELLVPLINTTTNEIQTVLLGSKIRGIKAKSSSFSIDKVNYVLEGKCRATVKIIKRKQLIEDAFTYINTPYLWGGKSPMGIDCSGFVQMVYAMNGLRLPRDASQQVELGHALSFIEEAEDGDLAFFANAEGKIIHVGIMLSNNRIIHASGKVRIDRIDHQGIFREDLNDYSHKLRIIKKII
ncbi:MAG: C40 family peptidase [Vicingaceae bacterium]